jgi:hypothetical protein
MYVANWHKTDLIVTDPRHPRLIWAAWSEDPDETGSWEAFGGSGTYGSTGAAAMLLGWF